jgi:hypothetical protein
MIKEVFKTVLAGILAGTALMLMPFILLRIIVIFLLLKFAFGLLGFGRRGFFRHHHYHNLTDEQKEAFRKKYSSMGCCHSEKATGTEVK